MRPEFVPVILLQLLDLLSAVVDAPAVKDKTTIKTTRQPTIITKNKGYNIFIFLSYFVIHGGCVIQYRLRGAFQAKQLLARAGER